jgi:predicted nucleic acid-binding protein
VIILDASIIVSAALRAGSLPEQAVLHAAEADRIALSDDVEREIEAVLARPGITRRVPA